MTPTPERDRNELRDANSCIALGAGLGAMGTGTALLVGATCPLCVVFAPALIGYGVWKRFSVNRERSANAEPTETDDGFQRS
jgi:hypothetical protein